MRVAAQQGEIGDFTIFSVDEVVTALFVAVLDRSARPNEIKERADALLEGTSLVEMAVEIVGSEEARQIRCSRFVETLARPECRGEILACPVSLRAEDVFSVLGEAHCNCTGRNPGFDEITKPFAAVVGGARLSDQLRSISGGDEALSYKASSKPVVDTRATFAPYIALVYAKCLNRSISDAEIDIWYDFHRTGTSYRDILLSIDSCEEANTVRSASNMGDWDDGTFIQLLYELIAGRGAAPREIDHYQRAISGGSTRLEILQSFFTQFGREAMQTISASPANDPSQALLFGKSKVISIKDWRLRDGHAAAKLRFEANNCTSNFKLISKKKPLVSIITSLFKGGRYIQPFLENITSQSIFKDYCELLIIDANSPEGEFEKARPFLDRFDNIRYQRFNTQLGIYEAWNIAIKGANGDYITNANLDDCRRADSFEIQASALDNLPFVDVVYQDVLYSFMENMDFETIASFGFTTEFPIISRYNLLEFNSPHNGPMWRKSLHEDVGFFDPLLRSAGDFDFWMRCVLANKTFYKSNDAHVAYYVNPRGLSTRSDTPGAAEANRITRAINRRLISPYLTMDSKQFATRLTDFDAGPFEGATRYALAQSALRRLSTRSRTLNGNIS